MPYQAPPERCGNAMFMQRLTSPILRGAARWGRAAVMAYWLIRSEPSAYSWDAFVAEGCTEWTGVKNATAAIHLRAMAVGDGLIFYHSNEGKEAVGTARVTRTFQPDPTDPKWVSVEVECGARLPKPVTLATMKAEPRLSELRMIRQSRLSVSPVSDAEWAVIMELAR